MKREQWLERTGSGWRMSWRGSKRRILGWESCGTRIPPTAKPRIKKRRSRKRGLSNGKKRKLPQRKNVKTKKLLNNYLNFINRRNWTKSTNR